MKLSVSVIVNPSQGINISDSTERILSVFMENMSEQECEIIHLQTDLSLKTTGNDTNQLSYQFPLLCSKDPFPQEEIIHIHVVFS